MSAVQQLAPDCAGVPYVRAQLALVRKAVDRMHYVLLDDSGDPCRQHIATLYSDACLALTRAMEELKDISDDPNELDD